jgi:hypothetical protein
MVQVATRVTHLADVVWLDAGGFAAPHITATCCGEYFVISKLYVG